MSKEFVYLESEDAAFARAFNLSEQQVIDCYGSLKAYTVHRLDRQEARRAYIAAPPPVDKKGSRLFAEKQEHDKGLDFDVPFLPASPEAALNHFQLSDPKLTEVAVAKELIKEQVAKVGGILQAVRANRDLRKASAQAKQDDQQRLENEARYLSRTYPDYSKDTEDECMARAIKEVKSRRHAI